MLHFLYLGKCFTYSERLRTTHEKFLTSFWSQILCQKHTQNYSSKMSWYHLKEELKFWKCVKRQWITVVTKVTTVVTVTFSPDLSFTTVVSSLTTVVSNFSYIGNIFMKTSTTVVGIITTVVKSTQLKVTTTVVVLITTVLKY